MTKKYDIFLYYAGYHGKKPQHNKMAKLLIQKGVEFKVLVPCLAIQFLCRFVG